MVRNNFKHYKIRNHQTRLSLGYWNVQGLVRIIDKEKFHKLENEDFVAKINKYDIVCMVETHTGPGDVIEVPGYHFPPPSCRPKSPGATKFSGGIAIGIRTRLKEGVKFLNSSNPDVVWLKLSKTFFNFNQDVFIAVTYISPERSAQYILREDPYQTIEQDIVKYSQHGICFGCGDFNAYTGVESDLVVLDPNIIPHLNTNSANTWPERQSCDRERPINDHGKALLSVCKSTGAQILNGRTFGDLDGAFTCYSPICKTPSLIDYFLCTDEDLISYMTVDEPCEFSDHCLLSCIFNFGNIRSNVNTDESSGSDSGPGSDSTPYDKFLWDEGDSLKFSNMFASTEVENMVNMVLSEADDIESLVQGTTKILTEVSARIGVRRIRGRKNKKRTRRATKKQWFDDECYVGRKELRRLGRGVRKQPFDRNALQLFQNSMKKYNKLLSRKRRQFKDAVTRKLDNVYQSNPKEFWKLFDSLKIASSGRDNKIEMTEWVKFFSESLNSPVGIEKDKLSHFESFVGENIDTVFNTLNLHISEGEIQEAIGKLKSGKASSEDLVLNEMLKSGGAVLSTLLAKIFNRIFVNREKIPQSWSSSVLFPLHKKGDSSDPANYRAISIGSNLSKLYALVLQRRLAKFAENNNLVPECQIGYRPGSRTADHVFALRTMVDKYVKCATQGKLFCCFVDFKNAFPSVCRSALFYKLLKCGIGGNFLQSVMNLYSSVSMKVKVDSTLGPSISVGSGLRQGCVLSPLLFNIFTGDLPGIFTEECDAPLLGKTSLGCLMYADDLVIMSRSAEGLQNSLNKLDKYCKEWGLTVNESKTKVLIFNKQGRTVNGNFLYRGNKLEIVSEYVYLGMTFVPSGSFEKACSRLCDQASRAFFKIKQFNLRNSVRTMLKLFDTLVLPILTYCSEVWGPYYLKNLNDFNLFTLCEKLPGENLLLKFCRHVLAVNRKTVRAAVRGELGIFPLLIQVSDYFTRYWERLHRVKTTSFLFRVYQEAKALPTTETHLSWAGCTDNFLARININESLNYSNPTLDSLKSITKQVSLDTRNIYTKQWFDAVESECGFSKMGGAKLRTYKLLKCSYSLENYLISLNFEERRVVTKLRISSHQLEIERQRHKKVTPAVSERKCRICSTGETEDELHFLIRCPSYSRIREEVFSKLREFTSFADMNDKQKFIYLLGSNDTEVIPLAGDLVSKLFILREKMLNELSEA